MAVLEDPDFAYLALRHYHNLQEMYHYTEWYTSLPPLIPIPQRLSVYSNCTPIKGINFAPHMNHNSFPDYTRFYSGSPGSSATHRGKEKHWKPTVAHSRTGALHRRNPVVSLSRPNLTHLSITREARGPIIFSTSSFSPISAEALNENNWGIWIQLLSGQHCNLPCSYERPLISNNETYP